MCSFRAFCSTWALAVFPALAAGTATGFDERALAEVSCNDSSEALLTLILDITEASFPESVTNYVTCDYLDIFLGGPSGTVGTLVHSMFLDLMPGYESMGLDCDTDLGDLCLANGVSNHTICNALSGKTIRSEACCHTCAGEVVTAQIYFGGSMQLPASEAEHLVEFLEGLGYNISTEGGGNVCSWRGVICLPHGRAYSLLLDHLGLTGVLWGPMPASQNCSPRSPPPLM